MDATDPNIRAQTASQYQLSAEAVEKIYDVMEHSGMSFADAALHLGFIRKQDIPSGETPGGVLSGRREMHVPQAGLIEMAINRISAGRDVVLRQGSEVTPGPQLLVAFDKANPRYEKMRALRTELLLLNETTNSANIMAILSPGSGEGRSQLCAELALSFAQLGRRTLLVDADMRTPHQHVLFGSRNEFGLSQAISQNTKPYLHPVRGPEHMFLLSAGLIPSNPLELLSDGRCERLLADWRGAYEFVIIDTPPVSLYSDALAMATMVGRVLILSRAKMTSYKNAGEMMRRLKTTRAQILGGVINHF
jgi:capsular exopolysaccharide synthesis family protein